MSTRMKWFFARPHHLCLPVPALQWGRFPLPPTSAHLGLKSLLTDPSPGPPDLCARLSAPGGRGEGPSLPGSSGGPTSASEPANVFS